MIDQVVAPDDIEGSLTRLVLVNAVYFKGLWKSRFRPENTKKRPFYGADGKTYQVPMLSQLSIFRCGKPSDSHCHQQRVENLLFSGACCTFNGAVLVADIDGLLQKCLLLLRHGQGT